MCLAVPGKVIRITENPLGMKMGDVQFGGITKEICLSFLPDVQVGSHILAHAGFAISQVDEEEAKETLELLRQLGDISK